VVVIEAVQSQGHYRTRVSLTHLTSLVVTVLYWIIWSWYTGC